MGVCQGSYPLICQISQKDTLLRDRGHNPAQQDLSSDLLVEVVGLVVLQVQVFAQTLNFLKEYHLSPHPHPDHHFVQVERQHWQ